MERETMVYWGDTYAQNWCPRPLVQPAPEDIAFFESCLLQNNVMPPQAPVRALLLGVTRAIAAMRWPAGTDLVSLDWSEPVIRRLWHDEGVPAGARPIRGDWREMPLATGCRTVALSDGSYHSITSHEDGVLITRELARVLAPGGLFCTRNFVATDPPERIDDLFDELYGGKAGSLHVFRWRLAAAMQGRSGKGVPRHDIWRLWQSRVGDAAALKAIYGDADRGFVIFERFRNLGGRLFYYTLSELEALCAGAFERVALSVPTYPGGERFPRLALRARG
jgi:SAM-dependent methyltransferase